MPRHPTLATLTKTIQTVPFASAQMDCYPAIPIPSNHKNMPKFQDRECIGYKRVVQELQRWVSRLDANAEFTGQQTQDSAVPEAILNQVAAGPNNVPRHGSAICGTN